MCGIAGIVRPDREAQVEEAALRRMARAIRHRGPDGYGLAFDAGAGFVSTRLAIVDLAGGWQPMLSPGERSLIVYNGEVYNHVELRPLVRGEALHTSADTEVVLRLLEQEGPAALQRLNGQFAFALWDRATRRLTLVRDRFGVRPLHHALLADGSLVFGSEAKALFASGEVTAALDPEGLDEVFTLWSPQAPRTAFQGVRQLPPGSYLVWQDGRIVEERRWWRPEEPGEAAGDLRELLDDAVRLRLRADVPVGTYLSGGLDSSLVTALAQKASEHELRTFSLAFRDTEFDERAFQQEVASSLGTRHHVVEVGSPELAEAFPQAIASAETPVVRTAPVPLMLLARATRANGITVVATGEGADELFLGYDLHKEVKLRAFCARDPQSTARQALLDRLYPYLQQRRGGRGETWRRFFLDAGSLDDPLASHRPRIAATAGVKAFYRADVAAALAETDPLERLRETLPEGFGSWPALERAAHLERTTLLGGYLLAAQGDRMAMAHGVEGRYPFLDHRVYAHAAALPSHEKLCGLREKVALRRVARDVLPATIANRPKQPYRAPEIAPFFDQGAPAWVAERLSPEALRAAGIFDERVVAGLVRRCAAGRATGFRESMALVGVLSTQVLHQRLCSAPEHPPEQADPRVLLDLTPQTVR